MTEEEKAIENLIKDYEICIKEAEYEGNVEQKEGLTEVKEILKNALNLISNLQKENEELKEEVLDRKILMEQQQKELDLKDKVIEKTCRYINEAKIMNKAIPVYPNKVDTPYTVGVASIEEIKQHFYKQVEKVGGEDE